MNNRQSKRALAEYAESAEELAESVKDDVVHNGVISKDTILRLNNFTIAKNYVKDLIEELKKQVRKFDN